MATKKVVSKKIALGFIALCLVLSAVLIGVFMQSSNSNKNLQNQVASKDLMINSLNSTVNSLNATVGNLNSTVSTLNAQIASLQKQVKTANSVNTGLQNQVTTDTSELSAANSEISILQNEVQLKPHHRIPSKRINSFSSTSNNPSKPSCHRTINDNPAGHAGFTLCSQP